MVETNDDVAAAREGLMFAADKLREALSDINRYADQVWMGHLAYQDSDQPYGAVYAGLRLLIGALCPDTERIKGYADKIIEEVFASGTTVALAAGIVEDAHAPKAGYSEDEIRLDLRKYRAWLITLNDGMLDPTKVVGDTSDNPMADAREWLTAEIAECTEALAYRDLTDQS